MSGCIFTQVLVSDIIEPVVAGNMNTEYKRGNPETKGEWKLSSRL